jgi:hypothetical protein
MLGPVIVVVPVHGCGSEDTRCGDKPMLTTSSNLPALLKRPDPLPVDTCALYYREPR